MEFYFLCCWVWSIKLFNRLLNGVSFWPLWKGGGITLCCVKCCTFTFFGSDCWPFCQHMVDMITWRVQVEVMLVFDWPSELRTSCTVQPPSWGSQVSEIPSIMSLHQLTGACLHHASCCSGSLESLHCTSLCLSLGLITVHFYTEFIQFQTH